MSECAMNIVRANNANPANQNQNTAQANQNVPAMAGISREPNVCFPSTHAATHRNPIENTFSTFPSLPNLALEVH